MIVVKMIFVSRATWNQNALWVDTFETLNFRTFECFADGIAGKLKDVFCICMKLCC